jgi:hypothetical protein
MKYEELPIRWKYIVDAAVIVVDNFLSIKPDIRAAFLATVTFMKPTQKQEDAYEDSTQIYIQKVADVYQCFILGYNAGRSSIVQ